MVKPVFRILLPILWACAVYGCNVDIGGLFTSTDLSERLKEKNNPESLRRLSPLALGEEYSFIVMTDIHIEDGNAHGLENIKTVIENNPEIKFAVFCGDLTQNGKEQDLNKFLEIADSLGIPAYPVIGNHDIYFGNFSVWKKLIGSTSYRVDGEGATLFILDSANSFLGKDQLDWLENELKSAQGRVFVFSHHNLFVDSPVSIQQMSDTREIARLISLVRGKRGIMFTGHSHERLVKKVGDSLFISIEDFYSSKTYCLVSVTKTGVSYEFKNLNNK
jgi:predicted phosphodiesterase